jgi:2-dehydro-3-deoxyphosphogluconate aldolase/(4S)-4-hydroxy-2-oxoglutarate aldolase
MQCKFSNGPAQNPRRGGMCKAAQLERLLGSGIVAVIRAPSGELLVDVAEALLAGGVIALEITFTVPRAPRILEQVADRFGERVLLGAGTVLDAQSARIALTCGAQFVVSPVVNHDVIRLCRRYDKLVFPGALTPTEVLQAWEAGADIVKVFPADVTDLTTAAAFLEAGACALGVGGALVSPAALRARDFDAIQSLARQYVDLVRSTRRKLAGA